MRGVRGEAVEGEDMYAAIQRQIRQLTAVVSQKEDRKRNQWADDKEVLSAYVSALSATRTVLKEEQDKAMARTEPSKRRKWGRGSQTNVGDGGHPSHVLTRTEVEERLDDFRQRVKEAEQRVEQVVESLSNAVRKEERSMLEDQITIMRETRKLCLEEAQLLETMLKEIEVAEQQQKKRASDWEELERIKDQLTTLEAKIDQAKRCLLFPSVHGYRFRVGTGGIYVGAKDLYLSDLSAGFSLSVESVRQAERSAVIRMHMGGRESRSSSLVAAETDSSDECVDTQSVDANEINNHPPSSPSVHTGLSAAEAENSIGLSAEEELEAEVLTDSVPAQPLASEELQTHPLMQVAETTSPDPPAPEWNVQDDPEEEPGTNVVQTLQRRSPGKNMAARFLSRIADKSRLPKGVALASQALFFTQPHRRRKSKDPSSPSQTLLKKFVLTTEDPSTIADNPRQTSKLRTPLQYSAKEHDDIQHPFEEKTKEMTTDTESLPDFDASAEVYVTESHAPLHNKDDRASLESGLVLNDASHRRATSAGGGREMLDSLSRMPRMLNRMENSSSENQSDTTSMVGAGRRGVHVKLQGTHVSLIGEKGTRVPNITVREITLEVECSLSVVFEFTEKDGWQSPEGLKFEVVQLRKKAIGNSVPLPAGLVKTLLNAILPKIVERALLSALPKELGTYILESGKGLTAAGEVIVLGPPLSTTQARLNTPSPYGHLRARAADLKAYSAVQEAQSLLSLDNDQAMLLGECFSKEKWGLLDSANGWSGVCSISELCRYYDKYKNSEIWLALCDLWNKAIGHVAKTNGIQSTLDFSALMNGIVSRLAAKPVRTQCLFTRLNSQVNVDAFLLALRDYCERSARELHADKPMSGAVPLDQQLQALYDWYSQTKSSLVGFKSRFKSFMSAIVARADATSLQIGLEQAQYEGPLHFQLPIVRENHEAGILSFDVSIPAPADSNSTRFMNSLTRALHLIHVFKTADGTHDAPRDSKEKRQLEWGVSSATEQKLNKALQADDDQLQFTESLSLGKAFLQRLRTSVTLNEEYLAQKLINGGGLSSAANLKSVLERLGDVVAGDLIPDVEDDTKYTLTFGSSDYARFKCSLETLGFQSSISPAEVFSMVHICIREYLMTFWKEDAARLKAMDCLFKHVVKYVDKQSLDVVVCSKMESTVTDGKLMLSLSELGGSASGIRYPIQLTNDFDISLLMDSLTLAQGKLEA